MFWVQIGLLLQRRLPRADWTWHKTQCDKLDTVTELTFFPCTNQREQFYAAQVQLDSADYKTALSTLVSLLNQTLALKTRFYVLFEIVSRFLHWDEWKASDFLPYFNLLKQLAEKLPDRQVQNDMLTAQQAFQSFSGNFKGSDLPFVSF